jgi:hypothetical protein
MSATILLLIALIWFGPVVVWSPVGSSFFIGLGTERAVALVLVYLIQIFAFGWIVPLALGAFRLA